MKEDGGALRARHHKSVSCVVMCVLFLFLVLLFFFLVVLAVMLCLSRFSFLLLCAQRRLV